MLKRIMDSIMSAQVPFYVLPEWIGQTASASILFIYDSFLAHTFWIEQKRSCEAVKY
jgi:hypothetical protein